MRPNAIQQWHSRVVNYALHIASIELYILLYGISLVASFDIILMNSLCKSDWQPSCHNCSSSRNQASYFCADFPNVVAQLHIFGGADPAAITPKFELGWDFRAVHLYPPSFIITKNRYLFNNTVKQYGGTDPMFTRSEVIVLTNKQTNKRRWKHLTLFAALRRWVKCIHAYIKNLYSVN